MTSTARYRGCYRNIAWFLFGLTLLVGVSGCGGCGKKQDAALKTPPAPKAPPPPQDDAKEREAKEKEAKEKEAKEKEAKEKEAKEKAEQEAKKAAKREPPLPAEVDQWKRQDFLAARRKNDRRLDAALTSFQLQCARLKAPEAIEDAVSLLTELVTHQTPRPAEDAESPPPADKNKPAEKDKPADKGKPASSEGKQPAKELLYQPLLPTSVRTIVTTLASLPNKTAQERLRQIVLGQLTTDDDPGVWKTALDGIQGGASPEQEEFFFRLLTAPETIRPKDEDKTVPTILQTKALAWAEKNASETLRGKLAKHLVNPVTPASHRKLMGKFLMEPAVVNVVAQKTLYGNVNTPPEVQNELDRYFIGYSSDALAVLLQIVPSQEFVTMTSEDSGFSFGRSTGTLDLARTVRKGFLPKDATTAKGDRGMIKMNLACTVGVQLWGGDLIGKTLHQLKEGVSIETTVPAILLASTIPNDALRGGLHTFLRAHVEEGTAPLVSSGIVAKSYNDPGLLIVTKSLPRRETVTTSAKPSGRTRPGAAKAPPAAIKKKSDDKQKAGEVWMKFSEDLVRALCEDFHIAGQYQKVQATRSSRPLPAFKNRPLELPEDAQVLSEYYFDWASSGIRRDQLPGVSLDPLKVYYVRFKDRTTLAKASTFYHKQTGRRTGRIVSERSSGESIWWDSCRVLPNSDRKESADWLFTVKKNDAVIPLAKVEKDMPIDLIVEFLLVETRSPDGIGSRESPSSDDQNAAADDDKK